MAKDTIGIDVSKDHLDAFWHSRSEARGGPGSRSKVRKGPRPSAVTAWPGWPVWPIWRVIGASSALAAAAACCACALPAPVEARPSAAAPAAPGRLRRSMVVMSWALQAQNCQPAGTHA